MSQSWPSAFGLAKGTVHGLLRGRSLLWADSLASRTQEAVGVGVLNGNNVLIVHHVFRPDNSVQILEVGAAIPWHARALGKVIAAHLDGSHRRQLLAQPLPKLTGRTLVSSNALEREFTRIERAGFATDDQEAIVGEAGIAAPVAARRQALAVADQAQTWAGESGASSRFASLPASYRSRADAAESLAGRIEAGAAAAARAYGEFSRYLRVEYREGAAEADGVGPDRYRAWAAHTLGADLDPEESYEWAWEEFTRLAADRDGTAAKVLPDVDFADVRQYLNEESALAFDDPDGYIAWHQEQLDRAMDAFSGTYFDIPNGLRLCEAAIPAAGGAAAPYYTGPTVDGSVPGRIWFPIAGRARFPMWSEQTTSFHEGVPGHHLQVGLITLFGDGINPLRRFSWSSAYSEGWALYAERFCDELGMFDGPEFRLGVLAAQLLRATRVIVDIGLHLDLPIGPGQRFHPAERWTPELAGTFLAQETGLDEAFISSEIVRYLGWPSQAIGYKLGERAWLEGRDRARRNNREFDLRAFHTAALNAGPLGLDQLADELATM